MPTGEAGELLYVSPEIALANDDIGSARPIQTAPGDFAVEIRLTPAGQRRFADFTGAHIGERAAILVGGRIAAAPTIRARIAEGLATITGHFTEAEASRLAESTVPK